MEQSEQSEKIEQIAKDLQIQREEVTEYLKKLIPRLVSDANLIQVSAESLSYRVGLCDSKTQFQLYADKIQRNIKKKKKELHIKYLNSYEHRLDTKIREVFVDADNDLLEGLLSEYKQHIEFLKESIHIIDTLHYSVKNKIELLKIFGN